MKRQLFINLIIFLGSLALSQDLQSIVNKTINEIKSNDLVSAENALKIYPDYQKAIKALNNVKKRLSK